MKKATEIHRTYKRNPLRVPSPQVQNRELPNSPQPVPPNPMQFRQNASPITRRELNPLILPFPISPHTHIKLNGILIPTNHRRRTFEIAPDIIVIRHRKRIRVQRDDRGTRDTQYPLIPPSPGVFDHQEPGQVLRFLDRRLNWGRIRVR